MKKEFRAVPQPDDIEGMERDRSFHPATTESPQALSAQQVESFNRDGFLKNLEVYKKDEIASIRGFFDELLQRTLASGEDSYSDPQEINNDVDDAYEVDELTADLCDGELISSEAAAGLMVPYVVPRCSSRKGATRLSHCSEFSSSCREAM